MAEADPSMSNRPARPISPHIQIYKREANMVMSILHRITGGALYFGTLLLAWWLVALASGPGHFDFVNGLLASPLGLLVMAGFTWALLHHLLGGIRHLIWDTGRGFNLSSVNALSWATIIGSLALTTAVWLWALRLKGMI